jgi:predicted transcriptional regulator
MEKGETIKVKLSKSLKRRMQKRAERFRRPLSVQIVADLMTVLEAEDNSSSGKFLGMFAGSLLPRDEDIQEVRSLLWGHLGRRNKHL